MQITQRHDYEGTLEIIEGLRDHEITARVAELRREDRFTKALRSALRAGIPIEDLSDASGLTCTEIRRRVDRELHLGEDLDALTGAA